MTEIKLVLLRPGSFPRSHLSKMFITAHRVNYCVELDHGMNPRLYPFVFLLVDTGSTNKDPQQIQLRKYRKAFVTILHRIQNWSPSEESSSLRHIG
jgi:hypothetical protein